MGVLSVFIVFAFFSVLQRRISFAKLPPFNRYCQSVPPPFFWHGEALPVQIRRARLRLRRQVYFDYKIALFFVKEVFACCGTGFLGCYESGTAKRFSLALQFLQGEASCSERAFASLSG